MYIIKKACVFMCVWGCLDKYISVATWPPQTKISGSVPTNYVFKTTYQTLLNVKISAFFYIQIQDLNIK